MYTDPASRSAFTTDSQPTLADLVARIQAATDVPKRTRQNWCWALRTIAKLGGKELDAVPAHPEFLRRLMAKATPAAAGLGGQTWNNARSLTSKAMEWAGLAGVPAHYMAPLTAEWQALQALLPRKTALAYQLSRLMHYCSAQGIAPGAVNDEVFTNFHRALTEESIVQNPYECYRGAAKSWNSAAGRIPGWPVTTVAVPSLRPPSPSLPWDAFPQSLREELARYKKAATGRNLDYDFVRPQTSTTVETRDKQLRWYANALVQTGIDAAALVSFEVLLDTATAKQGLEHLLARRTGETYPALDNLAKFLPALGRRIGLPKETIAELDRFKRRLKFERHGMAERHRPTLDKFNDPAAVEALLTLSRKLRELVERSPRKGRREAKLMQTAVAIEILLVAPVRVSNLASTRFDEHLVTVGVEPSQVHLRFPAEEVKNRVPLEFPLPEETRELIEFYLREYLPLLEKEPSGFLFPGKTGGRSKVAHALSLQIKKTVFKFTALDMPAHRFRHAAGKIFLDRCPGQYEVVRLFLGHKNIETTIAFYAGAEGPAAARHYANTILGVRGPRQEAQHVR